MKLRSVELTVPQPAAAAEFLERVWRLAPVRVDNSAGYFRGSGTHPWILSLEPGEPAIRSITFSGTAAEVKGRTEVKGPEGQVYRFVVDEKPLAELQDRDAPIRITHVVLNTRDREACERFAVEVLGFKVSDRTRHMTFVRSDRKHHCLAFAQADAPSLNHIAFEMKDLDAVMRGIGRMRDAGFDVVWGPGRHGPGNNVFGYFVAPWGGLIEYTSEVSEVGEDYKVGAPEDWTWPPGRIDHWGVSKKDTARTAPAEKAFRFRAA
ncbi:MAG TPA: VOC family protein [Burkholderiales bacterium]|nr:VOC family protein [Burkholderiales bacterium]